MDSKSQETLISLNTVLRLEYGVKSSKVVLTLKSVDENRMV